jgi:hypothetical protein
MSEPLTASGVPSNSSAGGTLALMSQAARDGAADAREAATLTLARTSLFLSRFVYTTCYTVSYGVVFSSVLLARSIPRDNTAGRGLVDGSQAACQRVDVVLGAASSPDGERAPG